MERRLRTQTDALLDGPTCRTGVDVAPVVRHVRAETSAMLQAAVGQHGDVFIGSPITPMIFESTFLPTHAHSVLRTRTCFLEGRHTYVVVGVFEYTLTAGRRPADLSHGKVASFRRCGGGVWWF